MTYYNILTRRAKSKKADHTKCWPELSNTAEWNTKQQNYFEKQFGNFLQS